MNPNQNSIKQNHKASELIEKINKNMELHQTGSDTKRYTSLENDTLIVNQQPDLPLRVSLSQNNMHNKTTNLKKKNIERLQTIVSNQEQLVELEKSKALIKTKLESVKNKKKLEQIKEQRALTMHLKGVRDEKMAKK